MDKDLNKPDIDYITIGDLLMYYLDEPFDYSNLMLVNERNRYKYSRLLFSKLGGEWYRHLPGNMMLYIYNTLTDNTETILGRYYESMKEYTAMFKAKTISYLISISVNELNPQILYAYLKGEYGYRNIPTWVIHIVEMSGKEYLNNLFLENNDKGKEYIISEIDRYLNKIKLTTRDFISIIMYALKSEIPIDLNKPNLVIDEKYHDIIFFMCQYTMSIYDYYPNYKIGKDFDEFIFIDLVNMYYENENIELNLEDYLDSIFSNKDDRKYINHIIPAIYAYFSYRGVKSHLQDMMKFIHNYNLVEPLEDNLILLAPADDTFDLSMLSSEISISEYSDGNIMPYDKLLSIHSLLDESAILAITIYPKLRYRFDFVFERYGHIFDGED